MAHVNLLELCRLCAKSGDAFNYEINQGYDHNRTLNIFSQYSGVKIVHHESLSSKVCSECHEKIIMFDQYLEECKKIQELFLKWITEETQSQVKIEEHTPIAETILYQNESQIIQDQIRFRSIKVEPPVENEYGNDNRQLLVPIDKGNDSSCENAADELPSHHEDSENSDPDDEKPLTLLKRKRRKKGKIKLTMPKKRLNRKRYGSGGNSIALKRAELENKLRNMDLKNTKIIPLQCKECNLEFLRWMPFQLHFAKVHKRDGEAICICEKAIRSKSVWYQHNIDHKKLKLKLLGHNLDDETRLSVSDFINFICVYCKKDFVTWYRLKKHLVDAHRASPIVHCLCGITIKSKSTMYKHIADHKDPTLFTCHQCPTVTKTAEAMEKHKLRHVPKPERVFKCESCPKTFRAKENLKSHERVHIPREKRQVHPCDQCDLRFTTRSGAQSHKRAVHQKIKSYICDLCGYACSTSGELKQHRAIHSDDKPYSCDTCSKSFKTYSNLKTHMDIHAGTSYPCYICCRVLNSRRTLKKHLLVHDDSAKHVCSYCNKAFKRRQTLKVHMHSHTGDKPLACKWCGERFAYGSTLRSHKLRAHPDKLLEPQHEHERQHEHADEHLLHDELPPMSMAMPMPMPVPVLTVVPITMNTLQANNIIKAEKTMCDSDCLPKTLEKLY